MISDTTFWQACCKGLALDCCYLQAFVDCDMSFMRFGCGSSRCRWGLYISGSICTTPQFWEWRKQCFCCTIYTKPPQMCYYINNKRHSIVLVWMFWEKAQCPVWRSTHDLIYVVNDESMFPKFQLLFWIALISGVSCFLQAKWLMIMLHFHLMIRT